MPIAPQTANLTALQTALAGEIANLQALVLAGPQAWVDWTIDGESKQYEQAKAGLSKRIAELQRTIQDFQPFYLISRAR